MATYWGNTRSIAPHMDIYAIGNRRRRPSKKKPINVRNETACIVNKRITIFRAHAALLNQRRKNTDGAVIRNMGY